MSLHDDRAARAENAYHRLNSHGVKRALEAYRSYLHGESGISNPSPMSYHTIHHLPAVLHLQARGVAGTKMNDIEVWIKWADILSDHYRRDEGTDMTTPAWRDPIVYCRKRKGKTS